ncbi:MAG: hypothetical protein ABEK12_01060, partial [Candidatus Nanohaloarchaea archaeon]
VAFARHVLDQAEYVAILTDFDQEGRELNGRLQELIPERRNRKIWRKKLGKVLTGKGRRDIEAINNIVD